MEARRDNGKRVRGKIGAKREVGRGQKVLIGDEFEEEREGDKKRQRR